MTPVSRAFYLTTGEEPFYALFDAAARGAEASSTSVLLCPLFGNDDLCAYRARREWAKALAAAGHPTLRIDLPSTGDSAGGPHDPGRVGAWTDAVARAAAWLSEQPVCARVTAIGIGLGGLLAYRAAAEGAAIDDLALWSVPARGRTFVRELRVFSQMEASSRGAQPQTDPPPPERPLVSAGFSMSAETVGELELLDLTKLTLPDAAHRRVLLLKRDGLEVDKRLRAALAQSGADLTVAPGPGYGRMVAPPQQSRAPEKVIATVAVWLAQSAQPRLGIQTGTRVASIAKSDLELTVDGVHVRESPLTIAHEQGQLVGVLAAPEAPAPLCALLLNAGALRHIGQNRMWVETARRWAALGVPTLRIDLEGIGDSDGDATSLEHDEGLYVESFVEQTREVLDALVAKGLPPRFVLAGLCSGAYWSLQTALEDERVAGVYMVNPRALFWDARTPGLRNAREVRKLAHASSWQKLLRGEIKARRIGDIASGVATAMRTLPAGARGARQAKRSNAQLEQALDHLEATGAELVGVFTAEEPLLYELERDGRLASLQRRSNVRVELIPGPLTSHTLEPLPLQQTVHRALDGALTRQLATRPATSIRAGEPAGHRLGRA